jgi:PAS domain S-box-containing protein
MDQTSTESTERKKLLEISTKIASTLNETQVMQLLAHGLTSLLRYDTMAIYNANHENQLLVPISIEGANWKEISTDKWTIPFGSGILGSVMTTQQGELVNNSHLDSRSIYPPKVKITEEHIIAIPLRLGNNCWGAFAVNRMSTHKFTEEEFETAQFLASYASLALNNIKLINEIKDTQALKQVIFDTISDSIITVNERGKIIFCNEATEKVFGYSTNELLNDTLQKIIPASLRSQHNDGFRNYLNTGEKKLASWSAIELPGQHKSGKIIPIEVSFGETKVNGQKVFSAVIRDISERKKNEELIKSTKTRLENLIKTLQAGILVEDENRKIVLTNRNFCDLFNITAPPEVLGGVDCSDAAEQSKALFSDPEKFVARITQLLADRRIVSNEEITMANGKTVARDYVPLFVDEVYKGHMWLYRDITYSKNIEQDLILAKELAEESVKAKQNFLATMSHELRTPINGVLGLTNLIAASAQTKENQEYLKGVKSSGEHLLAIINDILDLAKIEAGKMKLQRVDFDSTEILESIINSQKPQANEKRLRLVTVCDPQIPKVLKGDPIRLNQILYNLISNAIKFTEKGEVKITSRVLSMNSHEVLLELAVSDTGIGIANDKLTKIFESFTQADKHVAVRFGGTGLGLSIVKQLTELMNGKIEVESVLGKGSKFKLTIPLKIGEQNVSVKVDPVGINDLGSFEGTRILLAEDNIINQTVAKKTLEKWGIAVDVANNGWEAVNMVQERKYDLIIMDIQMPEMDGYQATFKIRNELSSPTCDIPIMAMTASVLDAMEKTFAAGMNEYISKPFNYQELNQKLKKFLKSKTSIENSPLAPVRHSFIDFNYLETISPGSKEFKEEMVAMFESQSQLYMAEIKKAFVDGNYTSLKANAHAFKPLGSYLGIQSLTSLVAHLEKLPHTIEGIDEIARTIAQIEIILDIVQVEINQLKENNFIIN